MKKIALISSLFILLGFTIEELVTNKLELRLINTCKGNMPCISAVKTQSQDCIYKSGILTYIKTDKSRSQLNTYLKEIHYCIKDSNGHPIFNSIFAQNNKPISNEEKEEYFQICVEKSHLGQSDYQEKLGSLYFDGYGTEKNIDKAYFWWEKAALNGNIKSQKTMGAAYILGPDNRHKYFPRDYTKAFSWYLKAANSGDSTAQTVVGSLYYDGLGVNKSLPNATHWWKKASLTNKDRS